MDSLLWIGIVQSCFTAVFLATKSKKALSDTILAVWMVFIALPLLSGAAIRLMPEVYIPVLRSDLVYPLTYGPFMWLYVGALTGHVKQITRVHLIHFLPFILLSLFQIATGWAPRPPHPGDEVFRASVRWIGGANLVLMVAYSIAVFARLFRHDQAIVDHFSNLTSRISLGWLRWLTVSLSGVFLLLFLASVLSMPTLLQLHLIAQIIVIVALSFFGLQQPQIFGRDGLETPPPAPADVDAQVGDPKARYSRSGLTEDQAATILHRLQTTMTKERPYLDPDITIEKLARRLAVPRHHLTEVINERLDQNFFALVNGYRIEAVKALMGDPACKDRTLLDMAYASGFNSKSSFNLAFKKIAGMTPSQYRQHQAVTPS